MWEFDLGLKICTQRDVSKDICSMSIDEQAISQSVEACNADGGMAQRPQGERHEVSFR